MVGLLIEIIFRVRLPETRRFPEMRCFPPVEKGRTGEAVGCLPLGAILTQSLQHHPPCRGRSACSPTMVDRKRPRSSSRPQSISCSKCHLQSTEHGRCVIDLPRIATGVVTVGRSERRAAPRQFYQVLGLHSFSCHRIIKALVALTAITGTGLGRITRRARRVIRLASPTPRPSHLDHTHPRRSSCAAKTTRNETGLAPRQSTLRDQTMRLVPG